MDLLDDELTVEYKFDNNGNSPIPCECGASGCPGFI
jgi:hypothetical protein